VIGKFDGGRQSDGKGKGVGGRGGEGSEEREGGRAAINDALEHVTLRNASAAICHHIYYLGDTSIRPLIIILITAARESLAAAAAAAAACATVLMTPVINKAASTSDIRAAGDKREQ